MKEIMQISLHGGREKNHEIDVDVFVKQLIAGEKLIKKIHSALPQNKEKLSIKVKAGVTEGSVIAELAIEIVQNSEAIMPLAVPIVETLIELVKYKVFLKNEAPKAIEKEGDRIIVTNKDNAKEAFTQIIDKIGNNNQILFQVNNFYAPIESGAIEEIKLNNLSSENPSAPQTAVVNRENSAFTLPETVEIEEITFDGERHLQTLSPNTDGKVDNWRVYDLEDESEYKVDILDEEFIRKVVEKEILFKKDSQIKVHLVCKKVSYGKTKRTVREVIEVLEFLQ